MVKIRLRRTGTKKKPSYRVVIADSRTPRDGRFIEIVGHYNPRAEPSIVKLHEDRVFHWLSVGAQPTDPVKKLLENLGTLDRFARLKQGAELEDLLAEAETTRAENVPAPKTQVEKVAEETTAEVETEEEIETEEVEASDDAPDEEEPEEEA